MAATPEGKVKDEIKAELLCLGIYPLGYLFDHPEIKPNGFYFMPVASTFGVKGVPDFILCVRGKFLAVEAKPRIKRAKPTDLQKRFLQAVEDTGGKYTVARSGKDTVAWLSEMLETPVQSRTLSRLIS